MIRWLRTKLGRRAKQTDPDRARRLRRDLDREKSKVEYLHTPAPPIPGPLPPSSGL